MLTQQLALAVACVVIAMSSSAQDDEIKQVVIKESEAYWKKDAATWKSVWLQDSSISRCYVSTYAYYYTAGWDSVMARQLRGFARDSGPDPAEIKRDSFFVRKDGNIAIVDFVQTLKFPKYQPPFDQYATREHRVMVKSNGQWKIANQITTETSAYRRFTSEETLNNAGYWFLYGDKVEEAIQIFELNAKFFPNSSNVWDSLAEAYAKAGKKDLAIQYYEKSVQMNPQNEGGKKALEDLRKK
ncbi:MULTISPECIES: tetratricopeptide repeat protein [Niastella]|uniref:Tetratricopeptide repeat protein n=1 Tax=Niastella soli TaxID=2821487 RepID=A0ABS3YZJ8_9BACT|nr:tetratricopeptide repeat protein [Niastella soli]MBO9203347.1 tetratricopeptide repeat protein [Niastella soli]